ncbi:MAG: hypothetical protein ACRD7E_09365 [Bryobacteraceae bacterium]
MGVGIRADNDACYRVRGVRLERELRIGFRLWSRTPVGWWRESLGSEEAPAAVSAAVRPPAKAAEHLIHNAAPAQTMDIRTTTQSTLHWVS